MRAYHCDRCTVLIEKGHRLPTAQGGHYPAGDLEQGITLKMPVPYGQSYVKWEDVDLCGACAKDLLEGFMKKEVPVAAGTPPEPAVASTLRSFVHSCPAAGGAMTAHLMHVSHPFCPACGLKVDTSAQMVVPGTQAEVPRQSPACGVASDPQSSITSSLPTRTHRCLQGVGRKGWYDSFPSDIKIDTNVDGTWRCHGETREWGTAIAHCPFCGVKLGELRGSPDPGPTPFALAEGWTQGLPVRLLLKGHRRFLLRDPGVDPKRAIPVKITTPSSVVLEQAAHEGQPIPWLAECTVAGDGHSFPPCMLAHLHACLWALNHEGKG